ncbi:MAG: DUF58 domain-containing protein [Cytophagales bacterium]|nr:MAG: DUF58 domain-containing protein [Cytophagales bacterium]
MKLDLEQIRKASNLELLAKQTVEGFITGLHQSPFHGFSVEFAEHRIYNPGESTRHIDWKIYAKTEKLFTKRYEEETNLRCQVLIDISPSMFYPKNDMGKLTFSVYAAACIAQLLQKQKDAVGITTFSDEIVYQSPIKSTSSHLHIIINYLQSLFASNPSNVKTGVANALDTIAATMNRRALIIIFSDMFENMEDSEKLFSALQHLKHNKHEVLLFHVHDSKTEINFDFEDRPYEFVDIETNERVKLHPAQIKEYYFQEISKYFEELKLKCGQYKIDFIQADIQQGVEQILTSYLIKRNKMK